MLAETVGNKLAKRQERVVPVDYVLRFVALLLLLTAAPLYEAFRVAAFSNGDIWWHLRTGLWIQLHHSIPRQGLFSQNANSPWIDSSWGFEVLLAGFYKLLGLRAISALLMFFKFALALLTFLLAGGWRRTFWSAVLLSAAVQLVLFRAQPLPVFCSIVFFGIELFLLLQSRRQGDIHCLYWLPPLFLLWANLDVQFVNGLLLLAIYLAAEIVERLLHNAGFISYLPPEYPLATTAVISALALAATVITPYSVHLLPEAMKTAYSHTLFKFFAEMSSLQFRQLQDFVVLLLVMAAFLALGLRHSRDLFKCALMTVSAMLAFRIQRDIWCAVLPSIAIIADALTGGQHDSGSPNVPSARKSEKAIATAIALAVILLAIARIPSTEQLLNRAGRSLPLKACDFIRVNQLPGPVFNSYAWGGFLIWYLPEYPVAIDGRLNLYGDRVNGQYFDMMDGTLRLENNPSFMRARTLLLEQNSALVRALTTLPALSNQFRVAYQDSQAVVLVRQ